jgi:2',3'-cyclic-nucleotide 2'-phosphodiesterase (5'-nucleotidase family)
MYTAFLGAEVIMNDMFPFRDEIVAIRMTGHGIRQVLEFSAAALSPEMSGIDSGAFLQTSGLSYTIDTGAMPYTAVYDGKNVTGVTHPCERVANITMTGEGTPEPLDDDRMYTVLVSSFLTDGGDGYAVFASETNATRTTIYDIDPAAACISGNSPVASVVEGRIMVLNGT